MVNKSKALLIFMAVAALLTVWLAWAILNADNNSALEEPRKPAVSPPLNPAAGTEAETPSPANTIQVAIDYEVLKDQPPAAEPLQFQPQSVSALESSAARNAPPESSMGGAGSLLAENWFREIKAPPEVKIKPATEAKPPSEAKPTAEPPAKSAPAPPPPAQQKAAGEARAASKPAGAPKAAASGPSRAQPYFSVQVAAFSSAANADRLKLKLEQAGEKAFIIQAQVEGRLWHRVMSGRFSSRPEAVAHEADLVKRKLIKAGEKNRVKTVGP